MSTLLGLIDDLGTETERVDLRIQRETRRIETTTRKKGNCGGFGVVTR